MRGVRGPSISCLGRGSGGRSDRSFFFSRGSRSRSPYPFCLYFRSMQTSGGSAPITTRASRKTSISDFAAIRPILGEPFKRQIGTQKFFGFPERCHHSLGGKIAAANGTFHR